MSRFSSYPIAYEICVCVRVCVSMRARVYVCVHRAWNINTEECAMTFTGHSKSITSLCSWKGNVDQFARYGDLAHAAPLLYGLTALA